MSQDEDYKYIVMGGRENVTIKLHNGSSIIHEEDLFLGEFWEPVIPWLADKFPKWQFVGESLRGAGTTATEKFMPWQWKVTVDGEYLGRLNRDYYGHKPCYAIENQRIANKRERGSAIKTVKVELAKKAVLKNFKPKDLKEMIDESVSHIDGAICRAEWEATSAFTRPYERLMSFMVDSFMARFDELSEEAVRLGFDPVDIVSIRDTWEAMHIKKGVTKCLEKKDGAVVLIHGNTYAVQSDKGQFYTCESATLPDSLKRKVGLLKLLNHEDFLTDVGYRKDDNTFYVCDFMEVDDNGTN